MTTIDTDLRERWIAALESGEYQQTDSRLRREQDDCTDAYAYCCLGVLCNLVDPNAWQTSADEFGFQVWGDDYVPFIPNEEVLALVGLDTSSAEFLAGKNDAGYTFHDIAEIIRSGVDTRRED